MIERLAGAVAGALLLSWGSAMAQGAFPSKPILLVIAFAPGGGTDITGRIVARRLGENLHQNVVVENRAGAGGNIATEFVSRAAPDGYTIALTSVGPLAVAPHMIARLPYDPLRDLAPVSMAVSFSNVVAVHPGVRASTLAEYLSLAADRSGNMSFATSGIGSTGHLAGALLASVSKVPLAHVPYKGGGPAMQDLLGGQVPSCVCAMPSSLAHIKAGKIRALATTGPRRASALPNVPTVAESGFPGYEATNWYAFVAPGKTPPAIIERLNREITAALRSPETHDQLAAHGMEPVPSTPAELARQIERELAVWGKVVKEAGISAN
jgi:tripartite-type tricarboxylate transporter receptor subunit TctC